MKAECDFLSDYYQYKKIKEESRTNPPAGPSETDWQRFNLTVKLANAKRSQYEHTKNESKWNQLVNEYYPFLCDVAAVSSARVELEIDEDSMIGTIRYISPTDIIIDNDWAELSVICKIMSSASTITIYTKGDFLMVHFIFPLYDINKVYDNSAQIEDIKQKIEEFKQLHRDKYGSPDIYPSDSNNNSIIENT